MNVLFLSLMGYTSIYNKDIYTDLLREFISNGHNVYIISPSERRQGIKTGIIKEGNSIILRVQTGNVQKTNIIEKGISTVLIDFQFITAIKKYFFNKHFDLLLYPTPPITITKSIKYIKQRDSTATYLMLKDIFPQNAVDIGLMGKNGIKGLIYHYFRNKEKKLYALSDCIGCMSRANVKYVLDHNPEIEKKRVVLSPNCIEVTDMSITDSDRRQIRQEYGIPEGKIVYIYGGNLGKPQGIDHMIDCIKSQYNNNRVFFLIIGDGTEYEKLDRFVKSSHQDNVKLLNSLPKDDYMHIVGSCDIGLLFLDHRFTIPNFPSRLLDYMAAKLPTLACTDTSTDVGTVIVNGGFGWWCESDDISSFNKVVNESIESNLKAMGEVAFQYLQTNWSVERQYNSIIKSIE